MTGLCLLAAFAAAPSTGAERASDSARWRQTLAELDARASATAEWLRELHPGLRRRVAAERPEWLSRLSPPPAVPVGYGRLPELGPDRPATSGAPALETRYDMSKLDAWLDRERRAIRKLEQALETEHYDLENAVEGYASRAENSRRVRQHVAYHGLWQDDVVDHPNRWLRPLRLLARYQRDSETDQIQQAREQLDAALSRFTASDRIKPRCEDSELVLMVPLITDIEDAEFLATFEFAIDQHWNESEALSAAGVRIVVEWDRRTPRDVYPQGPPEPGSAITLVSHLARFPTYGFVMTTGARSTHVRGRAIVIGSARTTRRTLAHEFGHLLGFGDRSCSLPRSTSATSGRVPARRSLRSSRRMYGRAPSGSERSRRASASRTEKPMGHPTPA